MRERAKILCILLRDSDRLQDEKIKALKAKSRLANSNFVSFGSNNGGGGGGGGGSSNGSTIDQHKQQQRLQSSPIGISSLIRSGSLPSRCKSPHRSFPDRNNPPDALGCPQTEGEEHIQLQLALAISKEEHEREIDRRRDEEAREQTKIEMALEQSRLEEVRQIILY